MSHKQTGTPWGHPHLWALLSLRVKGGYSQGRRENKDHVSSPSTAEGSLSSFLRGKSPSLASPSPPPPSTLLRASPCSANLTSGRGQPCNHVKPSRLQGLQKRPVSFDLLGSCQAGQSRPRNSHALASQAFQTHHPACGAHSTPLHSQLLSRSCKRVSKAERGP